LIKLFQKVSQDKVFTTFFSSFKVAKKEEKEDEARKFY
jgi:hypothetical protein